MKRHILTSLPLAIILATLTASADEKHTTASGSSSSSSTSSSHTDANGNTVTTTTTERDGKRETRRTVTGPGGKVISETNGDGNEPAKPAAEKGKPGGPWLGVHTAELPPAMREQLDLPAGSGLLVEQLAPDSPAGTAGIAQHDILLTFNLTPVSTPEQLRAELAKCRPGEKALIEYLHKSRPQKAAVTLGKRGNPEAENAEPDAAPNAGPKPPQKKDPQADPFAGLPKLNDLPGFPKGMPNAVTKSSTRTVIIGNDGKTKVIETDGNGDPFASMLKDPNVPESMKESLRKMQEQMRDFQKRAGMPEPAKPKAGRKESE